MKKTYRIKTNNQELLIRKQNESDATSRWIELQKTRPRRDKDWNCEFIIFLMLFLDEFNLQSYPPFQELLTVQSMLNSLKRSFYLMVVSWHYIIIFFLCVFYLLLPLAWSFHLAVGFLVIKDDSISKITSSSAHVLVVHEWRRKSL